MSVATQPDTEAFAGLQKIRVQATVEFIAYGRPDKESAPVRTIAHCIADSVAYRAPWLTDTEPDDTLVVVLDGLGDPGEPTATARVTSIEVLEQDVDPAVAAQAARNVADYLA